MLDEDITARRFENLFAGVQVAGPLVVSEAK